MNVSTKSPDRLIVQEYKVKDKLVGRVTVADFQGETTTTYTVLDAGKDCHYEVGDIIYVKSTFVSKIKDDIGSVRDAEILGYIKN